MKKQRNMDAFAPSNLWQLIRLHQFLTEKHPLTNNKQQTSMKRLIQFKQLRSVPKLFGRSEILIALLLASLAFLPKVQALGPVPDGGYPGGNTAEGQAALFSLTSGTYNTAVGFLSLRSNTEGNFNTGVGAGTLLLNTGDDNTATGAGALLSNTTGIQNTANGAFALFGNTEGSDNTAIGEQTLFRNTIGFANTATGYQALFGNTTGSFNTATGDGALSSNSSGDENTATGESALFSNTTGENNTANGALALLYNTEGSQNTAAGYSALVSNTAGSFNTATGVGALASSTAANFNTATGFNALFSDTTGDGNAAFGESALFSNTDGSSNTAFGVEALDSNTDGGDNTAVGFDALFSNTTGNFNTALGFDAGSGVTTANNVICIGASGQNVDNSCYIGQIYSNVQPVVGTDPDYVTITSSGRLGRGNVSSRRYKHDITPMNKASEVVFALRPVSFRYNKEYDATQTLAFGLIAEEVAEVNPDLVGRNSKGQPESVRYEQINAMLLNEFLKEHKKVEAQQATITEMKSTVAQQQKGMEILTAQFKDQAAQIQKVSVQLQISKSARRAAGRIRRGAPAPQIAVNP